MLVKVATEGTERENVHFNQTFDGLWRVTSGYQHVLSVGFLQYNKFVFLLLHDIYIYIYIYIYI